MKSKKQQIHSLNDVINFDGASSSHKRNLTYLGASEAIETMEERSLSPSIEWTRNLQRNLYNTPMKTIIKRSSKSNLPKVNLFTPISIADNVSHDNSNILDGKNKDIDSMIKKLKAFHLKDNSIGKDLTDDAVQQALRRYDNKKPHSKNDIFLKTHKNNFSSFQPYIRTELKVRKSSRGSGDNSSEYYDSVMNRNTKILEIKGHRAERVISVIPL